MSILLPNKKSNIITPLSIKKMSKIIVKAIAALVLFSLCCYWLSTKDENETSITSINNTSMSHQNFLNRTKRHAYRRRYKKRQRYSSNCKKVDFNVKFSELGWEKFIIYPKVFNAYLCSGNCELPSFMRRSAVPSTNHAQIISILEFKNPEIKAATAKCVSTRLKPLTVIFIDENGRIKTKVYKDMIVDQCGCR